MPLEDQERQDITEIKKKYYVEEPSEFFKNLPEVRRTKAVSLFAVQHNPWNLEFVPEDIKTNEIYLVALKRSSKVIKFIPQDKLTEELSLQALISSSYDESRKILEYIPDKIKTENFYSSLLKREPDFFNRIPDNKRTLKLYASCIMGLINITYRRLSEEYFRDNKITLSQYIYIVLNEANDEYNFNSLFETPEVKSKIINISNTTQYYTSFIEKIDYKPTDLKSNPDNFIWASDDMEQSLLHILEAARPITSDSDILIQAYIARYNIENTRVINSSNFKNTLIFNDIINPKYLKLITPVIALHIYMFQKNNPRITDPRMKDFSVVDGILERYDYFATENNKYILIILNELNKFLSEDKKIYGYKNNFDQKEIGLFNRTKIIDDSIKISKYFHIKFNNEELKFPCKYSEYFEKISSLGQKKKVGYSLKSDIKKVFPKVTFTNTPDLYRMYPFEPLTISYEDFDEADKPIERLFNKSIPEYFEKKYLKYKNKYLSLKNKINKNQSIL
jgi:hypothetical protein